MEDRIAELADRLDHLALDLAQLKRQVGQARAEQGALAAEVRQGFAGLTDLVRQLVGVQQGLSQNMQNVTDLAVKQVECAERTTGSIEKTTDVLYKLARVKPPDLPEPETPPKSKP